MRYALPLLFLLTPAIASAQVPKDAIAVSLAANVVDLISTEQAVRLPGAREWNPLLGQTTTQRVIVKSIGTGVQVWLLHKIGKRHPKAARIVAYSTSAVITSAAIHNWRLAHAKR